MQSRQRSAFRPRPQRRIGGPAGRSFEMQLLCCPAIGSGERNYQGKVGATTIRAARTKCRKRPYPRPAKRSRSYTRGTPWRTPQDCLAVAANVLLYPVQRKIGWLGRSVTLAVRLNPTILKERNKVCEIYADCALVSSTDCHMLQVKRLHFGVTTNGSSRIPEFSNLRTCRRCARHRRSASPAHRR